MHRLTSARLIPAAALAAAAVLIPGAALGASPTAGPTSAIAPAAATAPAPIAAAAPPCTTSGLVIWLDTQGNGAAGSIFYTLEFTNLSSRACTLQGYAGVSAVNLTGHALGSAAGRDHTITPRLVTLAGGASAKAVLRIVEAGNFPPSACRQVTAAGLRVYPPNSTRSKAIPFPFGACSQAGPVYLSVQALRHA